MLKKYDGLFILGGSLKDEALDKVVAKSTEEITRLGGSVGEIEVLGRRNFARTMQKRDNGVYVKVAFELAPDKVAALHARYRLNEDVFRFQALVRDERMAAVIAADKERRAARRAAEEAAQAQAVAEAAEAAAEAAEAAAEAESEVG
jgi:small subunit ribosomal protein S6